MSLVNIGTQPILTKEEQGDIGMLEEAEAGATADLKICPLDLEQVSVEAVYITLYIARYIQEMAWCEFLQSASHTTNNIEKSGNIPALFNHCKDVCS